MANQYHDEEGKFCSRGEMGAAADRLLDVAVNAPTPEARREATKKWETFKGELDKLALAESAPADLKAPGAKRPASRSVAKRVAAQTVPPADTFALPKKSTYKPVLGTKMPNSYGNGYVGGKAGMGFRDVADIAKDVRSDIKEAQAKGYLPKNLTYSVNIDKYAGSPGQSLTVSIRGGLDKDLYGENDHIYGRPKYTENAKEVEKRVTAIVKQYNEDDSLTQVDHFNTNFHDFVRIEDESDARFRQQEADRKKRMQQAVVYRKDLKKDIAGAGGKEQYFEKKYKFENYTSDGAAAVTRLDSASPMFVVRTRNPQTAAALYTVYDLSRTSAHAQSEADLLKGLTQGNSQTLRIKFAKYRVDMSK